MGSKITADDDSNHEIKRCLLIERKAMRKLGSILKIRDITFPTKVHLVKAMIFPVVMNRCESWTIKRLSTEELMLLNCGVRKDFLESLGLQGGPTSQSSLASVPFLMNQFFISGGQSIGGSASTSVLPMNI